MDTASFPARFLHQIKSTRIGMATRDIKFNLLDILVKTVLLRMKRILIWYFAKKLRF